MNSYDCIPGIKILTKKITLDKFSKLLVKRCHTARCHLGVSIINVRDVTPYYRIPPCG